MRQFESSAFALAGVVIAGLTFGSPASARAATQVVHPGGSIQAAVDAGSRGDTIVVRAGTYRESVTIHTNGLTLRAQGACPRSGFDSR
jgi:pectin methylesterase-like acyl-CoA thioesterase